MKFMQKAVSVVAIAAAATIGLSGCGASNGDKVDTTGKLSGTVSFQTWSLKNDKFTPYFESLIKDFEKKNPDVKVKWMDQPADGYQDKVLSQANANSLPDVINLPPDIAYPLVKAGSLMNIEKADPKIGDTFVKGAWQSYQYPKESGTYGLPWYLGTEVTFYNKTILEKYGYSADKLPTTNDEFNKMASDIAQKSNGQTATLSSMPTLDDFARADVKILDKDGKFVFNTDKAASIVDEYTKLYKEGAISPEALSTKDGENADLFKQGKVAFTTGTSSYPNTLQTDAPDMINQTVTAPRIGAAPLFTQGISVSKATKNKAAALAFAEFVTNTDNQRNFAKLAAGFAPSTKDGAADPSKYAGDITLPLQKQATEYAAKAFSTAKLLTPIQFTGQMSTYFKQQISLALKGQISSKDALDKIVKFCNQNLV